MKEIKILIVNPNSTESMTNALKPLIDSLNYTNTTYTYFTAPSGPRSINSPADCTLSTTACLTPLTLLLQGPAGFSAVLIACYSVHPLVPALQALTEIPVLGIFEASVGAALPLLGGGEAFGIVSTGKVWEDALGEGVRDFLGLEGVDWKRVGGKFAGCETTGLSAVELHEVPEEVVRKKVEEAVGRLVEKRTVRVVLLGCAGMARMESWVREVVGKEVWVVDGVRAGVAALQGCLRGGY